MNKFAFLICAVLGWSLVTSANDTAVVGVGGRWERQSSGKTSVQMVRENILMTVDQDSSYSVQADFEFRNTGSATTVKMGFPEGGGGDITSSSWKNRSAFSGFQTFVDGRPAPVKRQLASAGEGEYSAYWVKTVSFGRNQTRRVRVKYRTPYGSLASLVCYFCQYAFTGGNWKGKVESSVLTVRITVPGAYIVGIEEPQNKPAFVRRGQDFIYSWKNWEAEDYLRFRLVKTTPDWLTWPDWEPREDGLFAVKVPGTASDTVSFLPGGFLRDGKCFVRLRDFEERALKSDPNTAITLTKDKILIQYKGRHCELPNMAGGEVKYLRNSVDREAYVSASKLSEDLKVGFKTDLKAHRIWLVP